MVRKLLLPDGKMLTEAQIKRLSFKKMFDYLIELDIADRALYREFLNLQKPSKRSRKSTSRKKSRKTSRPAVKYVYVTPTQPSIIIKQLPKRAKRGRSYRGRSTSRRYQPKLFRSGAPGVSCNLFRSKAVCNSSPPCSWRNGKCA